MAEKALAKAPTVSPHAAGRHVVYRLDASASAVEAAFGKRHALIQRHLSLNHGTAVGRDLGSGFESFVDGATKGRNA
ncbi:hypothetical protein CVU37_03400 [candidate division BRC1 bacterium HGW-BRC1-1]|nr:MAG: hypothetical protein CVU37_03400 [candidate division BRC1 bacterium HGW-BRC1-1]